MTLTGVEEVISFDDENKEKSIAIGNELFEKSGDKNCSR